MTELLKYDCVDICYDVYRAVHDVSFALRDGEILGIVGESGSGKSTLIRAAMGLLGSGGRVTRGHIWYQGTDLTDLKAKEQRKINGAEIAMVFQSAGSSFCPVRTVGAQLYESVSEHERISRSQFYESARELLGKLGFASPDEILSCYPFELSGGMQQRVGIAAAMLLNPKALLADEPTSALDEWNQRQAVQEMLLLRKLYGTSIMIVTHNIGVVRMMADRVIVMKDGEIVEQGGMKEVLDHPKQEYTIALMSAVPGFRGS